MLEAIMEIIGILYGDEIDLCYRCLTNGLTHEETANLIKEMRQEKKRVTINKLRSSWRK